MKIRITFGYLITFLLFTMVMMEMHELVHISVGRAICGCWGPRDFNVWELCKGCEETHPGTSWLATFVGPLFSFSLMWLGMYWLATHDWRRPIGFTLIFSNIPFGRITTVMMGGGDEMVVIRHFLKPLGWERDQMIAVGTLIILLLGIPPIWRAQQVVRNKLSWLILAGFLTLPLVVLLFYTLTFLNGLLSEGVLSDPLILGTPALIVLHTSLALIAIMLLRKNLLTIEA